MKNTLIIVAVVALLAIGGWYFMSSSQAPAPAETTNGMPVPGMEGVDEMTVTPTGATKEFTVNGNNFKFDPATLSVKKGDTVKITFVNTGGFHDFVIDEFKVATPQIKDGQAVVEFVADKAGSFEYYCSVGTHRQMGMKGMLTVTE